MIRVTRVEHAGNHSLRLTFSDGSDGVADLSRHLTGTLEPLHNISLFSRAHLKRGVVTWNDDLDIATEFLYALAHNLQPPASVEDAEANEIAVSLRSLRERCKMSQEQVAAMMGVDQAEISRLERRGDTHLSTLVRFAAALGGQLEVAVRVGPDRVPLSIGDLLMRRERESGGARTGISPFQRRRGPTTS